MKILRLIRKDENNVIVNLDNGENLYLSKEVVLSNGLRKNQDISEDHFLFLITENKKFHIKQRAFRLLGRRLHSINELRFKLLQKDYEKELVENILNELIEKKYLDDYKFSIIYSDEKIRTRHWGKNKIKAELFKKKISSEIIEEVLKEKFPNGNLVEDAIILIEKKLKSYSNRGFENEKIKSKLFSFLYSRGYDFETSKEAINKLIIDNFN